MDHSEIQTESGLILDRRQLITGASALGLSAAFGVSPAMAQSKPKKGGTLRLGLEGGSASDSLDPRTYADSIPISTSLMLWNNLVEVADNGNATGELFENWEVKPGGADCVIRAHAAGFDPADGEHVAAQRQHRLQRLDHRRPGRFGGEQLEAVRPGGESSEGLAGGELQEQFAIIAVRQRAADQRLRLCGVELAIEQAARIEAQWPAPASTKRLSQ